MVDQTTLICRDRGLPTAPQSIENERFCLALKQWFRGSATGTNPPQRWPVLGPKWRKDAGQLRVFPESSLKPPLIGRGWDRLGKGPQSTILDKKGFRYAALVKVAAQTPREVAPSKPKPYSITSKNIDHCRCLAPSSS